MLEIFDGFIAAISTETNLPFKKEADGRYSVHVDFEGGRHQEVLVSLGTDEAGDPYVNYYSIIGLIPEDPAIYKQALKLNTGLTYGALGLMDGQLIIHQSYFLKNMDPQRFIKSLFYVAAKSDELEEIFTGEDTN